MSSDPVKRWQEHLSDAFNKDCQNYDDEFRRAIRGYRDNFKHYIVATASFEKAARRKEAAAIDFYGDRLNMKPEITDGVSPDSFKPIKGQLGKEIVIEKRGRTGAHYSRTDSDRQSVIGEVYMRGEKKKVRSIEGQAFPSGLNIECDRDERAKFSPGDRVSIKVAMSEKPNGTKYLVAAKTGKLVPA